ncbi:putative toxin-antitoxin system toxin component, PIN family [Pyrococcus kukulkanii]|uniref:putative toxin-antitoxin system toxin component, PIN family n=1 Tax=Pyrococcus kukulkanii TaxID=1609559 RepID=UPI003561440C
MAIRVVLDTSILVSALKSRNPQRSPAWRILRALVTGKVENYLSRDIYEEMSRVLMEIAGGTEKELLALQILTLVKRKSTIISPKPKFSNNHEFLEKLKDPDDAKFFDVAYSANAEYIISENTKHIIQIRDRKTKTYSFNGRKVKILRAKEFIEELSLK